jgi:AbrB family looped-hinge helix DNA binding protein
MNYHNVQYVIHRLTIMRSTITARGQTVIPAEIRQQFHLSPTDKLEWVVDGSSIRVIPVKSDPIEAFRGRGTGGSVSRLLAERTKDKGRE